MTGSKIDLRGQRFTFLYVPENALFLDGEWQCICDCGKTVWKQTSALLGRNTRPARSCGCRGKKGIPWAEEKKGPRGGVKVVNEGYSLPRKIYFAKFEEFGRVKIGIADDPEERLSKMALFLATEVEILALIDGNFVVERNYHKRFKRWHIRGEWFKLCDELLAEIVAIKNCNKNLA